MLWICWDELRPQPAKWMEQRLRQPRGSWSARHQARLVPLCSRMLSAPWRGPTFHGLWASFGWEMAKTEMFWSGNAAVTLSIKPTHTFCQGQSPALAQSLLAVSSAQTHGFQQTNHLPPPKRRKKLSLLAHVFPPLSAAQAVVAAPRLRAGEEAQPSPPCRLHRAWRSGTSSDRPGARD